MVSDSLEACRDSLPSRLLTARSTGKGMCRILKSVSAASRRPHDMSDEIPLQVSSDRPSVLNNGVDTADDLHALTLFIVTFFYLPCSQSPKSSSQALRFQMANQGNGSLHAPALLLVSKQAFYVSTTNLDIVSELLRNPNPGSNLVMRRPLVPFSRLPYLRAPTMLPQNLRR